MRTLPAGYVDPEPVREWLRALRASGVTGKQAAQAARVSVSTVWELTSPNSTRRRLEEDVAAAILAVPLGDAPIRDLTPTDATGTRRRAQALVAEGWTLHQIGRRVGSHSHTIRGVADGSRPMVPRVLAAAVAEFYRQAVDERPPVTRARAQSIAYERRWPPREAWDGSTIDDPDAEPAWAGPAPDWVVVERVLAGDWPFNDPRARVEDRDEVIARMRAQGLPGSTIRTRTGISDGALAAALARLATRTEAAA